MAGITTDEFSSRMKVYWDQENRVAVVEYDNLVVASEESFCQWRDRLLGELRTLFAERGRKFPLVVCVDNCRMEQPWADRFASEVVVPAANRYTTSIARYGSNASVRMLIATEAMRNAYSANLFDNKEEAVSFARQASGDPVNEVGDAGATREGAEK